MSEGNRAPEGFVFHGQTTFINQPRDTVIQNFQNNYIRGDGSDADKVNAELKKLVDLILSSKELPDATKEESVEAVHSMAAQVKEEKTNKITLKGTLQAVQEIVAKAADVAGPATAIIATVAKLLGLA